VSSFDGTTLVLATRPGGSATVQTSASTAVTKSVSATVSDIVANDTVGVAGPVNADGSYAATTVVVGALGNGGGLGGARRAGTAGTVTAVMANDLTLTTAQGSTVNVVISGSTVVTKTVSGTLSDLTPNEAVTLTGPQNADGSSTATRIFIGGGAGIGGGFFGGGGGGGATPATGA
jgi:hypothetical protein